MREAEWDGVRWAGFSACFCIAVKVGWGEVGWVFCLIFVVAVKVEWGAVGGVFWLFVLLSKWEGVRWAGFSGCFCVAVKVGWVR